MVSVMLDYVTSPTGNVKSTAIKLAPNVGTSHVTPL